MKCISSLHIKPESGEPCCLASKVWITRGCETNCTNQREERIVEITCRARTVLPRGSGRERDLLQTQIVASCIPCSRHNFRSCLYSRIFTWCFGLFFLKFFRLFRLICIHGTWSYNKKDFTNGDVESDRIPQHCKSELNVFVFLTGNSELTASPAIRMSVHVSLHWSHDPQWHYCQL